MKRWIICPMGDYENDGGNVPKISLYTRDFIGWTKPGFGWWFGEIAIRSLGVIQSDAEVYVLPDATMDITWGSINATTRSNSKNKVEAIGLDFSAPTNTWAMREVFNYIANQIQTNIDVEHHTLADVS